MGIPHSGSPDNFAISHKPLNQPHLGQHSWPNRLARGHGESLRSGKVHSFRRACCSFWASRRRRSSRPRSNRINQGVRRMGSRRINIQSIKAPPYHSHHQKRVRVLGPPTGHRYREHTLLSRRYGVISRPLKRLWGRDALANQARRGSRSNQDGQACTLC